MYHRPVVIFKPLQASKLGFSNNTEEMVTVLAYVLFYISTHMSVPGKIENHLSILDLEKAKPWELPLKSLKAFQSELGSQFKCKAVRGVLVNGSTPFVWAWKTIKSILNEGQSAKTVLVGENTCDEIKSIVCPC